MAVLTGRSNRRATRRDGGLVVLRPVRPTDRRALERLYTGASERSRRLRFFALSDQLVRMEVDRLVRPVDPDHDVVVATVGREVVGVASFESVGHGSAEAAVLVADEWQHDGIGTLLLEDLGLVAIAHGVQRLFADVLAENIDMLVVLHDLGFRQVSRVDGGIVRVEVDLDANAGLPLPEFQSCSPSAGSIRT